MSQQVFPELPVRLRRVRDSGALLFMLAFLGFLAYIIWDGVYMKETDVNLIVHGHDSYGNICGRNNKPIKLSDKSGQNYTDKPYTKYTLINSQFERYTLDSRRLKYGELVYVKERDEEAKGAQEIKAAAAAAAAASATAGGLLSAGPLQTSKFSQQQQRRRQEIGSLSALGLNGGEGPSKREAFKERLAATAQTNRILFNGNTINSIGAARPPSEASSSSSSDKSGNELVRRRQQRARRSAPEGVSAPLTLELVELAQTNRSLLNALKTKMMYQYPPMYGYSSQQQQLPPPSPPPQMHEHERMSFSTNRTNNDAPSRQRGPQQLMQNSSLTALTNHRRLDNARVKSTSLVDDDHLFAAAAAPANSRQETNRQDDGGDIRAATTSTTRYASSVARDSQPVVTLTAADTAAISPRSPPRLDGIQSGGDGRGNNSISDGDRYEHTFVTPISVMTVAATGRVGDSDGAARTTYNALHPTRTTISQSEVASQLLYLTECVESCPSDHVELIFYRCLPNNWRFSLFPNAINVTRTFIDDILTDVSHCYRELIYTFSLAFVLSLSLLILLRYLASIIIWSCLALLIIFFLSLASYAWLTFYNQIMDLEQVVPHDSAYAAKLASSDKWLIGSIFLTFVTFAAIGTILFMRKRILLVTTLFRESGKAIADMPLLLLQPLLTFAALVAITTLWLAGLVCLQSMKMPVVDMYTGFVVFRAETLYKIMKWYHIFAFLWVSHFAIACQHYVIGASVSKWYFSANRYELSSPIGTSISELILYYLGSVALGSFLVAIFKVIRVITRQIQFLVQRSCMSPPLNANQAMGGVANGIGGTGAQASSSSCGSLGYVWRLFIWFFDNIVMIINRDAYVEIAIHGHSFLGGARRAFTVLASNPLRLLAIKSVGNILLVIAKICVVVGTVSMAHVLLGGKSQQLNYSWSPIVITAIYSYVVAHWFLSVYEMVIDALFICYCEDYEQKNSELTQQINGSNFRAQILNNGQIY